MNRRFKIALTILLASLVPLSITAFDDASEMLPVSSSISAEKCDEPEGVLTRLSKYRTWRLVNPSPVKMEPDVAALCAAPPPAHPRPASPHRNKFISVYVNDVGQRAMMTERHPEFPQGSLIVKEKLGNKESQAPELLTVMLKREHGYNPKNGDWEYMVLDGAASKIVERGRMASCSSCHAAYSDTDFVTRIYLPDDVRRRLK